MNTWIAGNDLMKHSYIKKIWNMENITYAD